jgi:hypothetical protein
MEASDGLQLDLFEIDLYRGIRYRTWDSILQGSIPGSIAKTMNPKGGLASWIETQQAKEDCSIQGNVSAPSFRVYNWFDRNNLSVTEAI